MRAARVTVPGGVWRAGDRAPVRELGLRPVDRTDEGFILESAGAPSPGERATRLLGRCVEQGESVALTLTVGDREALLLHLRRLTFGEEMQCVLRCPHEACGEPMDVTLDVGDLLVSPYTDPRPEYGVQVDADASYDVAFRLPRGHDVDAAVAREPTDPDRAATEIVHRCVLRAERDGAPLATDALPEPVRAAVADAMSERDTQAEIELDLRCPECDLSFTAVFDTAAFLLAELEGLAAGLVRDVHTLALHYHWSEGDILRLPPRRRADYLALVHESRVRSGAA